MRHTPAASSRTLLAIAALLLMPALAGAASHPDGKPIPAPSFTLPTSNGTVSLDSLRGKVVLVDFWASWCVPCKSSFPWMSAMHEKYAAKGFTIVAINVDKSRHSADEFLDKHPAPFVVAYDPSGKTAKAFHVWGMPTSYLIGSDGAIVFSRAGFDSKHAKEVESMIQEALAR